MEDLIEFYFVLLRMYRGYICAIAREKLTQANRKFGIEMHENVITTTHTQT